MSKKFMQKYSDLINSLRDNGIEDETILKIIKSEEQIEKGEIIPFEQVYKNLFYDKKKYVAV